MLFLISLVIASAFAFLFKKPLKKHPYIFYAAAAVISYIVSAATLRGLPEFVNTYIIGMFSRGVMGTALWAVVMWTGALPNGSKSIKALMPVRGELSIIAAILTLGHNIGYGKTYFVRLFTDSARMTNEQIFASILTIAMLIIMIPLTVMSFPQVRKKMNAKLWKKIQRTAYVFYALIYIHVMTLFVPLAKLGRDGYFISVLIYSIVFISYAVCRVRKWYILRKKPETRKILNAVCVSSFAVLAAFPCVNAGINTPHNTVHADNRTVYIAEIPTNTVTAPTKSEVSTEAPIVSTETSSETTVTQTTATTIASEEAEVTMTETITAMATEISTQEELPFEEEPVTETEPLTEMETVSEPEQVYIYKNGTYTAKAYGYDGDVEVTITIENDVITNITGNTYESDPWYFDEAYGPVASQILSSQSTDVDSVSGATYSSEAIMSAVAAALDSARS